MPANDPSARSEMAEGLRRQVLEAVDRLAPTLLEVSHSIHANPETAFEEHHAHQVLTEALEAAGLAVERHACGLPTAFVARAGDRGSSIAVVCEYDALPGIGHACGHNIIAAAGLGAALALAPLTDEVGGTLVVLGTPAEEGGGGKLPMIEAGVLDDVAAAMMIHPADADLKSMSSLAIDQLEARYTGRASHAASAPEQGRNALDAAVLGYVNVAALRQHIGTRERVHGIFTDGGARPNVVPASAATRWYVRSPSSRGLQELKARVLACLQAGADAAGCTLEATWVGPAYAELRDDPVLLDLFCANALHVGRRLAEPIEGREVLGSTDMGNVSGVVPSIHPMLAVAPPGVAIHTPEFAVHAGGPGGDAAVLDGARAMALTAVDLWCDPEALEALGGP